MRIALIGIIVGGLTAFYQLNAQNGPSQQTTLSPTQQSIVVIAALTPKETSKNCSQP